MGPSSITLGKFKSNPKQLIIPQMVCQFSPTWRFFSFLCFDQLNFILRAEDNK